MARRRKTSRAREAGKAVTHSHVTGMLSHDGRWVEFFPICLGLMTYVACMALIAPWGNFPLNDDWQYAWVAKQFAETGLFRVDLPVAPTLFVQSLMAWPVIKWLGFSHTGLRGLTMVLGAATLVLADTLLRCLEVDLKGRAAAMLLWACNPFFLNLSASFMTEIYGYCLALAGCTLWFADRKKDTLSWLGCLGTAFCLGASFWVRQFCVLTFAALWSSLCIAAWLAPRKKLPWARLGASAASCAAIVAAYFPWAKSTGTYHRQFDAPLQQLLVFAPTSLGMGLYALIVYGGFFAFPWLVRLGPYQRWRSTWAWIAAVVALEAWGYTTFASRGAPLGTDAMLHKQFPLLANLLYDGGIGPINLADRYIHGALQRPHGATTVWTVIYWGLLLLIPAPLGDACHTVWRHLRLRQRSVAYEATIFALLLLVGMWAVTANAFGENVFDRYLLGSLMGAWILGALLKGPHGSVLGWRTVLCSVPLAYYSVAGMHDYFRWNEARWGLYEKAQALYNAAPTDIDGGFEMDGWVQATTANAGTQNNIGWYRQPRPFLISMDAMAQCDLLHSTAIAAWFTPIPALRLCHQRAFQAPMGGPR